MRHNLRKPPRKPLRQRFNSFEFEQNNCSIVILLKLLAHSNAYVLSLHAAHFNFSPRTAVMSGKASPHTAQILSGISENPSRQLRQTGIRKE